ncbi:MAG TPA: acyltransferase domain-containing protein, partial [Ktedonobacteraceae bacterium]|nr:acyltransferase domain-containing protein [Ktedonobacteraceae bacterium]
MNKYLLFNILPSLRGAEQMDLFRALLSNSSSALSTRISYELNLSGPSLSIQTACSTSLVAIHQACQNLLNYRCDMALAGGVSLNPAQKQGYYYLNEGPISADGHCRAFDARASGTIAGDGVGIVVLKRLEDAISDRDHIRAIIKGSAVNNDGSDKVGFLAPSVPGQANVIAAALTLADVSADTISYIEAHGTATAMGDPIEITALQKAFSLSTERKGFCAIGSVKTNIGHTDAAAGVAGFIKVVLALENRQLPPSLHFEQPNPHIDFANSPFYVNARLSEWSAPEGPRRAGVSAFGIGGTNAHIILEEAPLAEPSCSTHPWQLLTLSAKTETALRAAAKQLADWLRGNEAASLADVAYTLQTGRQEFQYRQAVSCKSAGDAIQALEIIAAQDVFPAAEDGQERPLAFLFPGGGAQYAAMGVELYRTEPVFRQQIDLCAEILHTSLGVDLRKLLYPDEAETEAASHALKRPSLLLAATFATEYALAQLWISTGVRPQIMIGHSLGEYTAACLAGVISLPDALELIVLRGRLYERIANGATLIVSLPAQEIQPLLQPGISLAAINSPSSCVVSGLADVIASLEQQLEKSGVSFHRLQADGAAHSSLLDPYLEEFQQVVGKIELHAPTLPFVSNLTGTWITAEEATDPAYWTRHLRQTVRFADGLALLLRIPDIILLEVGPGQTLCKLATAHPEKSATCLLLASMRHPRDPRSDAALWLEAVGQLWSAGVNIDWSALYTDEQRTRLSLPTYPFERQYYWMAPTAEHPSDRRGEHSLLSTPTWKRALVPSRRAASAQTKPWLVFSGEDAERNEVLNALKQANVRFINITPGQNFQRVTDEQYKLHPAQPDHFTALYQELLEQDKLPETVICLLDALAPSLFSGSRQPLELSLTDAFSCFYCLAHTFATEAFSQSFHFWLCSTNLYEVLGGERVLPERALVSGLCEALTRQYKQITCHVIDLDLTEEGAAAATRHLLDEVLHRSPEPIVAYRNAHRWLPLSEPLAIEQGEPALPSVSADGCYLITHGLRGAGYRLAEHLARLAPVKLALVEQEDLPPRSEWQCWLASAHEMAQSLPEPIVQPLALDLTSEDATIQQLEERIEAEQGGGRLPPDLAEGLRMLGALYICAYFRDNGVVIARGKRYRKQELQEKLRIIPKFHKFFETFLALLEVEAFITLDNEGLEFLKDASELQEASAVKMQLETAHPDFTGYLSLLEYAVRHYDQALSGEIETANILFPDGTYSLLQPVADQSMKFSSVNIYLKVVAELVPRIVKAIQKKERIRILEVGAGQGSLTWLLLSRLQGLGNVEYFFTDIAKSFVMKAEKRALQENIDWMHFGTLDIAQDVTAQGYDLYSFDIVIEYDVIHATKDISAALQNIKRLLVPDGVFLSIQAPSVRWTSSMIWGFAEGWWNFTEDVLRKHRLTAVLNYEEWENVLRMHGYGNICIYPRDQERRTYVDRMLIVSQQLHEPESDDYRAWKQRKEQERYSLLRDRIQRVQHLEELGAEVFVAQREGNEQRQLQKAIAGAQERFGRIRGVFHMTTEEKQGEDDSLRTMTLAGLTKNLRTSLEDIFTLEQMLRGEDLAFLLWILPDAERQGTAPILRSFAQAFVASRRAADGRAWTSVQWDLVSESNGTSSMQAERDEEIKRVLSYLLSRSDIGSLEVHPRPLTASKESQGQPDPEATASAVATRGEGHPSSRRRPNLRQVYVPPGTETEQTIARLWENMLGGIEVGIHDNFFELGGESLLATQLVSKLREIFQVEISIRTFFENATVAGISRAICEAKEAHRELQEPEMVALPRS